MAADEALPRRYVSKTVPNPDQDGLARGQAVDQKLHVSIVLQREGSPGAQGPWEHSETQRGGCGIAVMSKNKPKRTRSGRYVCPTANRCAGAQVQVLPTPHRAELQGLTYRPLPPPCQWPGPCVFVPEGGSNVTGACFLLLKGGWGWCVCRTCTCTGAAQSFGSAPPTSIVAVLGTGHSPFPAGRDKSGKLNRSAMPTRPQTFQASAGCGQRETWVGSTVPTGGHLGTAAGVTGVCDLRGWLPPGSPLGCCESRWGHGVNTGPRNDLRRYGSRRTRCSVA